MHNRGLGIIIFFSLGCPFSLGAQDITTLWLSMPLEQTHYLSLEDRKEMIECYNIGVDTSVENRLQSTSYVDTLAEDYGRFGLSSALDLQLVRLPQEDGDSILCVIHSYSAPATQSKVSFYSLDWHRLSVDGRLPDVEFSELIAKPDSMSMDEFNSLTMWAEPQLIEMSYDAKTATLEASLSIPYVEREKRVEMDKMRCKYILKWTGGKFEKCY